jgi:hypothetical protein
VPKKVEGWVLVPIGESDADQRWAFVESFGLKVHKVGRIEERGGELVSITYEVSGDDFEATLDKLEPFWGTIIWGLRAEHG